MSKSEAPGSSRATNADAAVVPAPLMEPVGSPPTLTYAFTARIELAQPVERGEVADARRRFVPITGGLVAGPRFTGAVIPGGGDWQTIHRDGLTAVDAMYLLEAADGTIVGVRNAGVRVASREVTDRITRGEDVPPDSYYFRSAPAFDPPPGPHAWMREKVFVGRGIRRPDHVQIQFFIVD